MSGAAVPLDHPEKVKDFAVRAIHEITVQSKAIIEAFYGKPDRLAYFSGCSAGGKQSRQDKSATGT